MILKRIFKKIDYLFIYLSYIKKKYFEFITENLNSHTYQKILFFQQFFAPFNIFV
jgi:hypothetical protein